MALLSIGCKVPHKDCTLQAEKSVRQQERILLCNCSAYAQGSRFFLSTPSGASNKWRILHPSAQGQVKMKKGIVRLKASKEAVLNHTSSHLFSAAEISGLQRFWKTNAESLRIMCHASNSSSNGKHLDRLDSYFGELEGDTDDPPSDSCNKMSAQVRNLEISAKEELENLDAYLGKLNRDANLDNSVSSPFGVQNFGKALEAKSFSVSNDSRKDGEGKLKSVKMLRNEAVDRDSGSFNDFQQDNKASDIYLVGLLASVNIGVFLFEIASPIKNSELQLFSLPLLYGAKINDLILVGEWWRLLTPMFLHAGGFHLIVGCWSLLTFGPQVCRGYGSFTFFYDICDWRNFRQFDKLSSHTRGNCWWHRTNICGDWSLAHLPKSEQRCY